MRRREFMRLAGGAATAWPVAVRAQRSAIRVIGFLGNALAACFSPRLDGFPKGLGEAGCTESRER